MPGLPGVRILTPRVEFSSKTSQFPGFQQTGIILKEDGNVNISNFLASKMNQ